MRIEAILLANVATIGQDGLLTVVGGGWRYVERDVFPATIAGNVCGQVAIEEDDFGALHTFSLKVDGEADHVDGSAGSMIIDAREESAEMSIARLPFTFPFQTVVREPTLLKAAVLASGNELAALSVIVRRTQPPDI